MHFEILVEDQSGKKMLDMLVPKIIGESHTFSVHAYKGIGQIPQKLSTSRDAAKRHLLNQLPSLLKGYGKTFAAYPQSYPAALVVVCDLDDNCLKAFRQELLALLDSCDPQPETRFCIAIEEGEAWLLGDLHAISAAYPKANVALLKTYKNDAICGTWEKLADAVYPGGTDKLRNLSYREIGAEKSRWAERITPHMDVSNNASPSFTYFRKKLLELAGAPV